MQVSISNKTSPTISKVEIQTIFFRKQQNRRYYIVYVMIMLC